MNRHELVQLIRAKKSMLCVGLDSDLSLIPPHLLGFDDPIFEFNKIVIDATFDTCVAYKPNLAFYEAMGLKGLLSLEKTVSAVFAQSPKLKSRYAACTELAATIPVSAVLLATRFSVSAALVSSLTTLRVPTARLSALLVPTARLSVSAVLVSRLLTFRELTDRLAVPAVLKSSGDKQTAGVVDGGDLVVDELCSTVLATSLLNLAEAESFV